MVPITPAKVPKIKYNVPMSLWLVEKNQRLIKLFMESKFLFRNTFGCTYFARNASLRIINSFFNARFYMAKLSMYWRLYNSLKSISKRWSSVSIEELVLSDIELKLFNRFFYILWLFFSFSLRFDFSVVLSAKMIEPNIAVNKIKAPIKKI